MSDRTIKWKPLTSFIIEDLVHGDLIELNPKFEHYHFKKYVGQVGIVEKNTSAGLLWGWFIDEGQLVSLVLQREKVIKVERCTS